MQTLLVVVVFALWHTVTASQGQETIRLVGGSNKYKGRVEVNYQNQWATVCDKNFDDSDARFICRSLGITNVETIPVYKDLRFGQGTGPVITDLGCSGQETSVSECMSGEWDINTCKHSEDVGIDCQTPVYLVGKPYTNNGTLAVTYKGSNFSVCSDGFGMDEANVVCRMLGFSTGNTNIYTYPYNGEAISDLSCTGTEADLSDCTDTSFELAECSTSKTVGVECQTKIRLVNGTTSQSGRVEIFFNDEWGTVCDDSFDDDDASVICRTLGLNPRNAISYGSAYFGRGVGPIIIDELECDGTEPDVSQCLSSRWLSATNCGHGEDAGVECLTDIRLVNGPTQFSGRVEVKQGTEWLTFCDKGFDNRTATVICNMLGHRQGNVTVHTGSYYGLTTLGTSDYTPACLGNETDIIQCNKVAKECTVASTVGINCFSATPIRLAGGWKIPVGKVEVFSYHEKSWLGLCHNSFSQADAQVVCRMLGHPYHNPTVKRAYGFYDFTIRGTGLSNLNCSGGEKDISDCLSGHMWGDKTCSYTSFVGVNCDPETPIRLVDGSSNRAGRVEVMYNNTWGGVCSYNCGTGDRDVMCKTLGHNNGSLMLSNSYYNSGSGPYIVSNLRCYGSEEDISDCKANKWLQTSCSSSYRPVGIACKSPVRLVNGSYERSGRVEVFHNGTWGTICADTFNLSVANVVCRGAGFRFWNASVLEDSTFGDGSTTLLNNLTCSGSEEDITICRGGPWSPTTCSGGAAAVDCRKQVTPIRLTSTGITPYSGDVLVFYNNKWGSICRTGITKYSTDVLCLNLGFNFSADASWTSGSYVSYTSYMITGLKCFGNESDVSECPSDVWSTAGKNCYSSSSSRRLKINCLTTVTLDHGRTSTMGRISLGHKGSSGSICDDGFTEDNGRVICSMLGYAYTRNPQVIKNTFNSSSYPYYNVIIDGLNCNGDETDIYQCPSNPWNNNTCSRTKAVGINCNTPIRLTNGTTTRTGKVHMMINGTWARVCSKDVNYDSRVGQVVCRVLGYSSSQVITSEAFTDHDEEITYTVTCNGYEDDISLCTISDTTCANRTVMHVACDTPLRLINGRTKYMGLVYVSLRISGGIRSTGINNTDANHVCRLLGYNFTQYPMLQTSTDLRQSIVQRSVVDKLHCQGDETDIADCIPNFDNWEHNSLIYSYMKINCQTPLRVINGQAYLHGEVQLYTNNTWIHVCSDDFTQQDAYVVCRMMGHIHVLSTSVDKVSTNPATQPSLAGDFRCHGDEEDVSQCSNLSWETKLCQNTVKVDCKSQARLVDGPTAYEGRVEVFYNETWWPVCYDNIGTNEAKTLCRMFGFTETSPRYSGVSYDRNDSLSLTNLDCVGTEQSITECSSSDWASSSCSRSSALSVSCYTPAEIYHESGSNPHNGRVRLNPEGSWRYICADSFDDADAQVICRMLGYDTENTTVRVSQRSTSSRTTSLSDLQCLGNETDVQGCNHSDWSTTYCTIAAVNCQPVTQVRLIDGPDNSSGRVEVFFNGHWGTVCDDSFDDADAAVFCSMLGYRVGLTSSTRISGSGPIHIDDLACVGNETDISDCPSRFWGSNDCGHHEDIYIECSDDRVRLRNGNNMYRGHVEIKYLGQRHNVCPDNMDLNDTEVICRELGVINQTNATIYNHGDILYSGGSRRINDLMCERSENTVDECASYPWTELAFCYPYSVAINCRPKTPIRLEGGPNKYSGRVEVEYPVGNWSTICDYDFDENDAQVICRSLGFNDKSVGVRLRSYYGYELLKPSISNLHCSSYEPDISECNVEYEWGEPYRHCDHTTQAGVQCNTPLRFSGGWTKFSGQLEVYYQQAWGTICGQGFDQLDAKTVCNIIGYGQDYNGHISIHVGRHYVPAVGEVVLSDLNCTGTEEDLLECGNLQWERNTCSHNQDVALNCRATTELRLMNGNHETSFDPEEADHVKGRVEVLYDGEWGTICNDHFDDEDAHVLCSMKGYIAGIYRYDLSNYGPGRGPITIDDLYCTGDEPDVSECRSREWTVHDCGHDEDVVIECYYEENPDPCKEFNHRPLPHLDSRYVNFVTEGLGISFNDSKLPTRWYNVGKEVMPNYAPDKFACGTIFPVYLQGEIPTISDGEVDRVACQVTNDSDCGHKYNISIKQCPDEMFVYKLGPTVDDSSGYCFGIGTAGEAPTFVPSNVQVTTRPKTYNFLCDFDESEKNLFYSVIWEIDGDRQITLTKGYCNKDNMTLLDLKEQDLINKNIKIGFKVYCSVRAYTVPGGPPGKLSDPSPAFFAGIQILTPAIAMRRGETKAIEFELTVPFSCDLPGCTLDLLSFTPDYGNCDSNGLSFSSGHCGLTLEQDDVRSIKHLNITSGETGQYGVAGRFQVFLQTGSSRHHTIWNGIKLPAIEVESLPEADRKWRGKLCAARNDPHMYTFDGRQYEHHVRGHEFAEDTKGTFILYQNVKYGGDVEIQHRVTPCTTPNNPAMCNCGVAVRAGRDVYVISVCDNHIDIGYKHCGDNTLTVKKEDDLTYTIYLPYGTAVRARIDIQPWMGPEGGMALDISINPSVYDQEGNSRGLCGTLDGDKTNDFHFTGDKGLAIDMEDRVEFINKWKVQEENSMFSQHVESMELSAWLFPVCVCKNDGTSMQDVLPCKSSIGSCSPGVATGTHSCHDVSSRRSVRSLRHRPIIPRVPLPPDFIAKSRSKRAASSLGPPWTNVSATKYCTDFLEKSKTFSLCQKVPSAHTGMSLDNCVLDVLLTNSTDWSALTLQSMQDSCISTVLKNTTVRTEAEKNETSSEDGEPDSEDPFDVFIHEIIETVAVSCKHDCNGNGDCSNGTCDCYEGFGGSDCSINATKPPQLAGLLNLGRCDEVKSTCDVIYGFGGLFLEKNITCRLRQDYIYRNGTKSPGGTTTTRGQTETLAEVMCPLRADRYRRSSPDTSPFVTTYDVSVSNTGEFSNEHRVYVYNSKCQEVTETSEAGITFTLKNGTCHINGQCYEHGETHPDDVDKICESDLADDAWTMLSTTVTTISTTTIKADCEDCLKTKIELRLNYHPKDELLTNETLRNEYKEEAAKELRGLYKERFGDEFVRVEIIDVRPGSLIIEHTITTIKKADGVLVDEMLFDLLKDDIQTTIMFFNRPTTILGIQLDPVDGDDDIDLTNTRETDLSLVLDYTPSDDITDINVQLAYIKDAKKAIPSAYDMGQGLVKIVIFDIYVSAGSLTIKHTIYTLKEPFIDDWLIDLIAGDITTLTFTIGGGEINAISLELLTDSETQWCIVFSNIHNCECEIYHGQPRCREGTEEVSSDDSDCEDCLKTKIELRLNYHPKDELLTNETLRNEYKEEAAKELRGLYKERFGDEFVRVEIIDVRPGSLIIEHTITTIKKADGVLVDEMLFDLLKDDIQATIMFFNRPTTILGIQLDPVDGDDDIDLTNTRETDLSLVLDYTPSDDITDINVQLAYIKEAKKAIPSAYNMGQGLVKMVIFDIYVSAGFLTIKHTIYTLKEPFIDDWLIDLIAGDITTLTFTIGGGEINAISLELLTDSESCEDCLRTNIELRLNYPHEEGLLTDETVQDDYKKEAFKILHDLYEERFEDKFVEVEIIAVRPGSLIIEHTITTIKNADGVLVDEMLFDLLKDDIQTTIMFFNRPTAILGIQLDPVDGDDDIDLTNTRETDLSLVLDYTPSDDITDINVQLAYIKDAKKAIASAYNMGQGLVKMVIFDIYVSAGSLTIKHTIYTLKEPFIDGWLIDLIAGDITTLTFTIGGGERNAIRLEILTDSETQWCIVFSNINNCECEIYHGHPRCREGIEEVSSDDSVLTIWLPVTCGLVIIILVMLGIFLYKQRAGKKNTTTRGSESGYNGFVPRWVESTMASGSDKFIASAPGSFSDGATTSGGLLPRLVTHGNTVTSKPEFYSSGDDRSHIYYGLK